MTNHFRQHVPDSVEIGKPFSADFSTENELRGLAFVKRWIEGPMFHRLSVSREYIGPGVSARYLVAEYEEGTKWYVIGYLKNNVGTMQLPEWAPPGSQRMEAGEG